MDIKKKKNQNSIKYAWWASASVMVIITRLLFSISGSDRHNNSWCRHYFLPTPVIQHDVPNNNLPLYSEWLTVFVNWDYDNNNCNHSLRVYKLSFQGLHLCPTIISSTLDYSLHPIMNIYIFCDYWLYNSGTKKLIYFCFYCFIRGV